MTFREAANLLRNGPAILAALREIKAYDDKLDGAAPSYEDARSPDGNDYNEILSPAMQALRLIEGEG